MGLSDGKAPMSSQKKDKDKSTASVKADTKVNAAGNAKKGN